MTLQELGPKSSGVVTQVLGEGALRRRLIDMGITPGVEIFVRKRAPFGDPLEINLRGYELSLRREEAEQILIQPVCRKGGGRHGD